VRSAEIDTATSLSSERAVVRPPLVEAVHRGGMAIVKPALLFLTVRHPGGGWAGRSARSRGAFSCGAFFSAC
jgi:hypothetical protein